MTPRGVMTRAEERDPVLAALERAAPYMDYGHVRGSGIRPSAFAIIRYCAIATSRDPADRREIEAAAKAWLAEARRRWRAGYAADPFTETPIRRGVA